MSLSDHDIELIEKYLSGELDDSQMIAFTEKKNESEVFSREVKLQQKMIASLSVKDDQLLRAELKEAFEEIDISAKKPKRLWYYAAATVSLLILALYFIVPTKNDLYAAYYKPLPESPISRGENLSNAYSQAMKQYSIGAYEKALQLFSSLENSDQYKSLDLYVGNCLLNLEKRDEAITRFASAMPSGNDQLQSHANWYLALAYLKKGDLRQAKQFLEILSKSEDNMYQQKSKELLGKLRWVLY